MFGWLYCISTLSHYIPLFTLLMQHVLAIHFLHQVRLYVAVGWCTVLFPCPVKLSLKLKLKLILQITIYS
jgi:hypothetical protein